MKLKIEGKSKELFDHYLTSVLNTASVVVMGGHIPNQIEVEQPERHGRYWFRETGDGSNKFNLYPMSNNYWAFITDEGDNIITLEFRYRYDTGDDAFSNALVHLLSIRFRDAVTILK